MNDFTITITLAELGRAEVAEQNSERLLDALLEQCRKLGPVVDADLERGRLSATIAISASDADAAFHEGRNCIVGALLRTGFEATKVVAVSVDLVEDADRELQPV